jgi:hypothetical protein
VNARLYPSENQMSATLDLFGAIDANQDDRISAAETEGVHLRVFGYSRGGHSAIGLTRSLNDAGGLVYGVRLEAAMPVETLVTLDAEQGVGGPPPGPMENVQSFFMYYQRRGGHSEVDIYDHASGAYIRTDVYGSWLSTSLKGDEFTSSAQVNTIVRLDTDPTWTERAVRHWYDPDRIADGEWTGAEVNHTTLPFYVYSYGVAHLSPE